MAETSAEFEQPTRVSPRRAEAGLSAVEVADRQSRGDVNVVAEGPSRTFGDIVRANVVTRFNMILGALLAVVLFVAPINDALFGVVLVVNSLIGIVQEVRAKRTLDRLTLLSAPKARVIRDARLEEVAVEDVVLDEVLELRPGDQVVVDGRVLIEDALEVDESLLTGESDTVHKEPGEEVLSGSFVVAGSGRYQATRVGADAYAARLAEEAKKFTLVHSELRAGIDWLLGVIRWLLIPTIGFLIYSQLQANPSIRGAIAAAVAGSVAMIPQGLVLLTSVAFAVSVLRLGRRNVLVQELPAVEGLARVDTVCFDKTGTLTAGHLTVLGLEVLDDDAPVREALGAIARADATPNTTSQAIADAFESTPGWTRTATVPFSSARKWSSASFDGQGTWILGAPEVVLDRRHQAARDAELFAVRGERVLVLARSPVPPAGDSIPVAAEPVALIRLGDQVRPDAAETLRYFREQGVQGKVISGDHPRTVAAIAKRVGMRGADRPVDGRDLPTDPDELADAVERWHVFGRITPHQKRAMVSALQDRGHVVAMTGDGVNDVLALKDADIGIAMGSGSPASRSVAQLVLLDGQFETLPDVVAEGRRVIANMERVANLFIVKTVYAFLLAIAVGFAGLVFPFLPRHLTLVGSLTIGIPAFFLALEPSARRYRPGFISRVLRFAIPVGTVAAAATFFAYAIAQDEAATLTASRTVATLTLGAIGVFALALVSRPLSPTRETIIGSVVVGFFVVLLAPVGRDFFALEFARPAVTLAAVGIVSITGTLIYLTLRISGWIQEMTVEDLAEMTSEAVSHTRVLLRRGWDSVIGARGGRSGGDGASHPPSGEGSPGQDSERR